ncbi:MAG: mandelate racemase/muconate lactonizing enzyme family protein [Mesorhizobium sp.]|uniref:mandelate racemase/muconate lactonizing enzyme family protein n=1 Tax=Mesorhizobium sp. M2A.F.Ca.ET.067.02.1.1 TaxID=2496749 RepID=UPI000FD2393D|nr:mandelate racemase/muconate lactonizing enzyme family protein [Mesorhizobium sp. M2A.F.Ca.ET.067.02.1.1]RUW81212.1 mandelate racemase/muconate lactonizing enzyme family protein [Mesorhizobium sp. M2A.F.Ca.ET.067.02.1.1]TIU57970.1 MAG: mandelate racemase/muconate lactonizing enzyme family protein [Mesorhizobium sp.]TIW88700.1 MAG: mandelate racemase/muconate lactonizing enzyme family protein [Mesorhizobium sp.]
MNDSTTPVSGLSPAPRIVEIAAVPLFGESPKGGWSVEIQPDDSIHALIAVHTDTGISGYGSVFTDGRLAKAGVEVLRPLLIGENAMEPERICERLHQNTFWMGRGGTLTHVAGGVDIALWDILGKALGQPVGRLLGGTYRNRAQPYCSLLMEEPSRMRDAITCHKERGFRAFKIGWGPFGRALDHHLDEKIVAAARDAIGTESKLFVDAGASDAHWPHGLKWATRTAQMLANYNVGWFEEPLRPDAIDDYIALRKASPVPVAGGEVLTRRQTFLPWLAAGALDIVQPDVTKVGGLSEQRRIAWMADDFGIRYVGHGWNTALGLAADLQLASALPLCDLVEFIGGSPYVDGLLEEPFSLDTDGYVTISDRPGLGITLSSEKVARYTPDPEPLFRVG